MKAPPHNREAERAVLGGVLLRPDALAVAHDHVEPEDFHVAPHAAIFRAMLDLVENGVPIDTVTLDAELRRTSHHHPGPCGAACPSASYLAALSADVPTAENIGHWAKLVREAALLRRVAQTAGEIAADAYDPKDVQDFLDGAERRMLEATATRSRSPVLSARTLMHQVTAAMSQREKQPEGVTGIATGFGEIDRHTGGLQPGELTILAARPSVGKTSFAVSMVLHAVVQQGVPALVFSLEMTGAAVGERLVCSSARVDSLRARTGRLDAEEWGRVFDHAAKLSRAPFWLDDNARTTAVQIRAKARRFRADRTAFPADQPGRVGLLVVDYLQLVLLGRRAESRQQEVGEVTRLLKATCKELGLHGLVLSQLNRAVEDRSDQKPRLSDLRESGEIEQHADNVAFLSRIKGKDPHRILLDLAKQRNGPVADCPLVFLPTYARFEEPSPSAPPPDWAGGG